MAMDQDSRGKYRIATRFLSHCRIEGKDTKTDKVAKGKRTNARYKQHQIGRPPR